ncbi:MAG TPA: hypothetical protein VD833_10300 [Vicinamibacterales bacterium]|nr:hypothetical protein [Vicinamibacterales bacterium]
MGGRRQAPDACAMPSEERGPRALASGALDNVVDVADYVVSELLPEEVFWG